MIKIACDIPVLHDVTSLYRALGPLAHLRRIDERISNHHLALWHWGTIADHDLVFMQRPYTDDHVGRMEIAKDLGVPVWIDYDDMLWEVPTDNPTYFNYNSQGKLRNLGFLLKNADHVSVSTEFLAKSVRKVNPNVTVIPNALNTHFKLFKERSAPAKRNKAISWRGSRTHHRDVFSFCQTIMDRSQHQKDWNWHFIGDNLWLVTDNMNHKSTFVHEPMDWDAYHKFLCKLAPAAMIVPLSDSPFNRAKSNIAWLEAAFAGAVAIGPDWEEWDHPGVLQYNGEVQFGQRLDAVFRGEVDVVKEAAAAWEYIQEHFTIERTNKLRLQIVESLIR